MPWNQDLMSIEYDGLFISNGPGDPSLATTLISNLQKVGPVEYHRYPAAKVTAAELQHGEGRVCKFKPWMVSWPKKKIESTSYIFFFAWQGAGK